MGNGVSDTDRVSVSRPVSVGENTFETTVTFSHLLEADTGAYNCSANITSPSLPNVITIASDSTSGSEPISIGRKCIKKLKLIVLMSLFCSSPSSYCLCRSYPRDIC